jgi:hypothetical protein
MGDRRYRAELAWLAGATLLIGLLWTSGGSIGAVVVRRAWSDIARRWQVDIANLMDRASQGLGMWSAAHVLPWLSLPLLGAAAWLGWRVVVGLRHHAQHRRRVRRSRMNLVLRHIRPAAWLALRRAAGHGALHHRLHATLVTGARRASRLGPMGHRLRAAAARITDRWRRRLATASGMALTRVRTTQPAMRHVLRRAACLGPMGYQLRAAAARFADRWRRRSAIAPGMTLTRVCEIWRECEVLHGPLWLEQRRRYTSLTIETGSAEDALWHLTDHPALCRAGAHWHGDCLRVAIQSLTQVERQSTVALPVLGARLTPRSVVLLLAWPIRGMVVRRHLIVAGPRATVLVADWLTALAHALTSEHLAFSACGATILTAMTRAWPHWIDPPGDAEATIASIDRQLRRGLARHPWRPVLLILSDLSDAQWERLPALAVRAHGAPLHLVLLQPPITSQQAPAPFIHVQSRADRSVTISCGTQRIRGPSTDRLPADEMPGMPSVVRPVLWQAVHTRSTSSGSTPPTRVTGHAIPAVPTVPPQPQHACWPDWPGIADGVELACMIEQLLNAAAIWHVQPPGLTRGRLAQALPDRFKIRATALLRWLDAAGLLVEPRSEALRWREPRALTTADLMIIAARLSDTPAPAEAIS